MRPEDLRKLEQPYTDPHAQPRDELFVDAIGVRLPAFRSLVGEILSDLDTDRGGIGWWVGLSWARRILISDHLVSCALSVETNVVEARLHILEALGTWLDQSEKYRRANRDRRGFSIPPPTSAADDLPVHLDDLHVAGFFRAVGSAMDCASAVIVGVLAIPTPILRADFDRVRRKLAVIDRVADAGSRTQAAFARRVEAEIEKSGPPGWLDWAIAYRNMFVHRGRRTTFSSATRKTVIYDQFGRPIQAVSVAQVLARRPDLSQVEALHTISPPPVLTEIASTTLHGVFESSRSLLEGLAVELLSEWRARRDRPSLLPQPREQWPGAASRRARDFDGYATGTAPFDPKWFRSSPLLAKRIEAAHLMGGKHEKWQRLMVRLHRPRGSRGRDMQPSATSQ